MTKTYKFEFCTTFPNIIGVTFSDGEYDACIQCPQWKSKPTAALLKHSEAATLPLQQQCVEEFQVRNSNVIPVY
jgi:hypothetical protein